MASPDWSFSPRIHEIANLSIKDSWIWVLRDDEAGFAVSGGKLRKYAALIPFLLEKGCKMAYILGGQNSNNLVGLAQYLLEAGIKPVPVLPEGHSGSSKGFNHQLLSILVRPKEWKMIPRADWSRVEEIVKEWIIRDASEMTVEMIPEGCFHPVGIHGAMNLAKTIQEWQDQHRFKFDHVVMEAGTGTSAIGLLMGGLQVKLPKVEVLLLAEGKDGFRQRLKKACDWFSVDIQSVPKENTDFQLHEPVSPSRFGRVGQGEIQQVVGFARQTGIVLDPIYGAKLWAEFPHMIQFSKMEGNILVMVSGGAHALAGYSDLILKNVNH